MEAERTNTKTKTPLDPTTTNLINPTPFLELKTRVSVDKKNILQGQAVIIIDPTTGKALGASDFFPALKSLIRRSGAITQNQWYDLWTGTAVSTGAGSIKERVNVAGLSFEQATAGETIELRIIADEVDETISQVAVAGTNYYVYVVTDPDVTTVFKLTTTDFKTYMSFIMFSARNLQIMYRKTTANGANATTVKVIYSQYG